MANQDTILSPCLIYSFLENFYGLVVGGFPKMGGFLGFGRRHILKGKKGKKRKGKWFFLARNRLYHKGKGASKLE